MRFLVVEDDLALRRALVRHLGRGGHEVVEVGTCGEAIQRVETEHFDQLVVDVRLPDGEGFAVVERLRQKRTSARVIMMTGDAILDYAVAALRRGADDFLVKPFSFEALDEAIRRLGQSPLSVPPPSGLSDAETWRRKYAPELLGSDPKLLRVFEVVRRVADSDCSVLITGETGTGKELVANALHRASKRGEGRLVAVNCAAIPETLMESELFGHSKGAFTGAMAAQKGRFALADGGTLLLDEVGEMPPALQAKLLRVLQEGEVHPIGEAHPVKVNVRVLAATHRDIDEMAARGQFREDLLYRLDVIRIELPSLRSRRGDIPALVEHFIADACARKGLPALGLTGDALAMLAGYDWPGNVRQLRHTIERMVLLATGPALGVDDVPTRIREAREAGRPRPADPVLPEEGIDLREAVEQFENALIMQALERTGWNRNQAAAMLSMNRTTLVEKLKKRGLTDGEP